MAAVDPMSWSVHEVSNFMRLKLGNDRLAQQFLDLDVDGLAVLTLVDSRFLRDECGILSLAVRARIVHAIAGLRKASASYANDQSDFHPAPAITPNPAITIAPAITTTPARTTTPAITLRPHPSVTETQEAHARRGETLIEDKSGKKRRKLELSAPPTLPASNKTDVNAGFLPDKAISLDDVFYGTTEFGKPVGNLDPPEISPINDLRVSEYRSLAPYKEKMFTFVGLPSATPGQRQFAYSQLRHLMLSPAQSELKRGDGDYLALFPYRRSSLREGLHPSASVFSVSANSSERPTREKALLLDHPEEYQKQYEMDPQAANSSEYDHLLAKWNPQEDQAEDKALPLFGESDTEDGYSSSLEAEIEAERQELEHASKASLFKEEAELVISSAIEDAIHKWNGHKRPKLEDKRAFTVWRQGMKSSSLRQTLVKAARQMRSHLQKRLSKLKEELASHEWTNEKQLRRQCSMLDPTVEDIQHEVWKLEVWRRTEAPYHAPRNQKAAPSHNHSHHDSIHEDNSVVGAARDLNVDALPLMENFVVEDDEQNLEQDLRQREASDSPASSSHSPPIPFVQREGTFDAYFSPSEPSYAPLSPDDESDAPMDISSPLDATPGYQSLLPNGSEDPNHGDIKNEANGLDESERHSINPGSLDTPRGPEMPSVRLTHGRGRSASSESSLGLPSPSIFLSQTSVKKSAAGEQDASSTRKRQNSVIELSSDHDQPATPTKKVVKRPRKSKKPVFTATPWLDSVDDIRAYAWADLEGDNADCKRLINKLILEKMDHITKIGLQDHIVKVNRTMSCDRIKQAMDYLTDTINPPLGEDDTAAKISMCAARLYAVWRTSDHCYYDNAAEVAEAMKLDSPDSHITHFVSYLGQILPRLIIATEPMFISSGDEGQDQSTSQKVRRRRVKKDVSALNARQLAQERSAIFEQIGSDGIGPGDKIRINLLATESKPIYLNSRLAAVVKPHQIDGIRFIWREITALGLGGGQGCLLAHEMGLGKTIQTIATLVTIVETARDPEARDQLPQALQTDLRALVLCPATLLENWTKEIDKWAMGALGNVYKIDQTTTTKKARLDQLHGWYRLGGVMLLSYDMFRGLTQDKSATTRQFNDIELAQAKEMILSGPNIAIADEVHALKNTQSAALAQAAQRIVTHVRIGLTASPLNNNVQEVYSLISWVAPGYLGAPEEFRSWYGIPIEQGTYADSEPSEVRKSRKMLAVLNHEIAPKVHRRDITVLKGELRPKVEFVLTVPMTDLQTTIYTRYKDFLVGLSEDGQIAQAKFLGLISTLTLICNHPQAFKNKLLQPKQRIKPPAPRRTSVVSRKKARAGAWPGGGPVPSEPLSEFEAAQLAAVMPNPTARSSLEPGGFATQDPSDVEIVTDLLGPNTPLPAPAITPLSPALSDENIDAVGDEDVSGLGISDEMIRVLLSLMPDKWETGHSHKALLVWYIIELSRTAGDKLLLFSHSIPSLNFLEELLKSINVRYGRVDGEVQMKTRLATLEQFNNGPLEVLLISTRAGSLGYNIQGANRVIIFDFCFNPTREQQAIGRAYRLGQKKPVFVYRFVAGGTFETNLYNKALWKTTLASRIVDKKNPVRNSQRNMKEWLYTPKPVHGEDIRGEIGKDPKVLDFILKENQDGIHASVKSIRTMETLQEDVDEPLTDAEKLEVQELIQTMSKQGARR